MDSGRQTPQLEIHVTDKIIERLAALGSRRYIDFVARTTHAVLDSKAETDAQLRWSIFHRRMDEIPAMLHTYVQKVTRHAYKVTDEDVGALKQAGYSEDAIFEITGAAALGASILRLERGLIALNESKA